MKTTCDICDKPLTETNHAIITIEMTRPPFHGRKCYSEIWCDDCVKSEHRMEWKRGDFVFKVTKKEKL